MTKNRFQQILKGNGFASGILRLGGGTALGQAVVVIATPLITRLYSPAEMGLLAIFTAFVGFASVGLGMRFEMAIVSAADDQEADCLLVTTLILVIPISALAAVIMGVMIHYNFLSYGSLPLWSTLGVFVTLIATGFFTSLRYWFTRKGFFTPVGHALVMQGAGRAIIPILLGWSHIGWVGLVLGEIAGRALGVGRLFRITYPAVKTAVIAFNRNYYWSILQRNWKFPCVVLPSSLIDALAALLPIPLVTYLFGADAGGQFFLVQRLISLPSALISGSIADVFYSRVSEAHRSAPGQVRPILWQVAKKLAFASALVFIPLALLSPYVFGTIFGRHWTEAGRLLSILSPAALVLFVVSPISRVLMVIDRSELKFFFDGLSLIVPLVSFYGGHSTGYDFIGSMVVYSILSTIANFLYCALIWYASGIHHKVVIK